MEGSDSDIMNESEDEDDEDNQSLRNCLTSSLEKFGMHIYHLSICFFKRMDSSTMYQLLQRWISLKTVNLRTLELYFHSRDTPLDALDSQDQELLAHNMLVAQMPQLEHLTFVKTRNAPSCIFKELLSNNMHIEKLQVAVSNGWPARYNIYFDGINSTIYKSAPLTCVPR